MATVTFYGGGGPYSVSNLLNSGIGFFGSNFGNSVAVGEYQDTTFICSADGSTAGQQINNNKYINSMSGSINGASAILVNRIPNYLGTLHISFTHDTSVRLQNSKLMIYDRSNINNDPSGVTCRVVELLKPDTNQSLSSSGANSWTNVHGSAVILSLADSPGLSGLWAGNGTGSTLQSTVHDFYAALSSSPNSVGSKTQFALLFQTEYL